ncbi:MAG: binding methyltransferase FtsJ like protein [Myxococcaceae bacterium]|nr:binding methyltransferase FtsJ like protein [Myxococcaceae bacterium]
MTVRERVDRLLVQRGLAPSRTRARALIEAGKVLADGAVVTRVSELFGPQVELAISGLDHPYVSRGGLKLAGALTDLALEVVGKVVADIGASTGGFTDCVLRNGARRVYALDVGTDQLHPSLRADARVVAREGINARHLTADSLPEPVDLVVVDASFISLTKLLPALVTLLAEGGQLLALVKPQFEVGPERVGRRGVVSDDGLRNEALEGVSAAARELGLTLLSNVDSRVPGPEGNREIFALFLRSSPALEAAARSVVDEPAT